jgi:hypothetical protein
MAQKSAEATQRQALDGSWWWWNQRMAEWDKSRDSQDTFPQHLLSKLVSSRIRDEKY